MASEHRTTKPTHRITAITPLLADLRGMDRATLAQDLVAGTLTAMLLIPQALAYALLAGLPPEVGLYASIVPPLVYALFGTSRTLAVGPVAIAAVMVSAALAPYAGDPDRYLTGALVLSALVGLWMLALGLLRLGWLTAFISHPVLSGFTTGAAIFIIGTQLPAMCGIPVARDAELLPLLTALFRDLPALNPAAVAFSSVTLTGLLLARGPLLRLLAHAGLSPATTAIVARTAPLALIILALFSAAALDAHERWDIAVVGVVPTGLPHLRTDILALPGWPSLLPSAALIALVAYVESISIAKALAFRRREKIDPNQELRALGATNLAAAGFGAMPVAGGFARSMVNFEAGARTQFAAIFTALWVGLAAATFAGLLHDLPKAVLATLIVVAVWQLIDVSSLKSTWRYDRGDGLAQAATLIGVLALGIELGLSIGVGLALLLFLYRTSRPHIAVVGRIAGTEHFRNIHRHVVETWPQLLLVRIDENLYFANTPRVESALQHLVVDRDELRAVVLILSGVAYIDASAREMLEALEASLAEAGIALHLAEVKGPVLDQLHGTALAQRLDGERIHISTQRAVGALTA